MPPSNATDKGPKNVKSPPGCSENGTQVQTMCCLVPPPPPPATARSRNDEILAF